MVVRHAYDRVEIEKDRATGIMILAVVSILFLAIVLVSPISPVPHVAGSLIAPNSQLNKTKTSTTLNVIYTRY